MNADELTDPLVSIITPSFNQGRFLAATIDSVLAQDYGHIEFLVVDGGSTDGSLSVLERYGDRVRWISEPDEGQADAVDKGIRQTQGEIVAWLNSDDRYVPGAITTAVNALARHPEAPGIYGDAEFIDAVGNRLGPCIQVEPFDLARLINVTDFVVQPAAFFRRTAYEAVGGLDRSLHYCLDYDLWIRMGLSAPLEYIPRPLAQVRIHSATKTSGGGLPRLIEIERMIGSHGRTVLPDGFQWEISLEAARAFAEAVRGARWTDVGALARILVRYAPRVAARGLVRIAHCAQ